MIKTTGTRSNPISTSVPKRNSATVFARIVPKNVIPNMLCMMKTKTSEQSSKTIIV